jgi:hypothetical protein
MPIWEITQERRTRWIWRIRADDLEEALRRIREDDQIPEDEELVALGDYEVREITSDTPADAEDCPRGAER